MAGSPSNGNEPRAEAGAQLTLDDWSLLGPQAEPAAAAEDASTRIALLADALAPRLAE